MRTNIIEHSLTAKAIRLITLCGLTLWSFASCTSPVHENERFRKLPQYDNTEYWHNRGVPVADSCGLMTYFGVEAYDSTGVLDYRFARDYAFSEFYSCIFNYYYNMGDSEWWSRFLLEYQAGDTTSLRFGDVPVVVYDYDNKPYYYEFPVIYDGYIEGQIVGTVTVAAQPKTKELVEYVFTAGLVYHSANFYYKRYVGEYPCVYLSDDGGTFYELSFSEDTHTVELEVVDVPYMVADRYEAMMEKIQELSSTEIADMNADIINESYEIQVDNTYSNLMAYINSFQMTADTRDYWINLLQSYHSSSSFTFSPQVLSWIDERVNSIERGVVGFLEEYESNNLRMTMWADACGPGILSWLYRGKYNVFNGKYLPIYGDYVSRNDYPCYWNHYFYSYYYMAANADEYGIADGFALREFNSNRTDAGLYYTFFQHSFPIGRQYALLDGGLRAGVREATNNEYAIKFITAPISWMINNEQPVVVEGIRGHAHYWGAIGYAYNQWWLGIKWNMRILVMDNGVYSCSDDNLYCYPYWSILGGLNYAWRLQ